MPQIFELDSYKKILTLTLEEKRKNLGRAYTYEAMAKYCQIQKTYLSRVFSGKGRLSSDQLYLACEFLGLSSKERDFAFVLLELENSQIPARRRQFEEKIKAIRAEHRRTEAHIQTTAVEAQAEGLASYYLDPILQLIHMYLTIPAFAREPRLVGESLGLIPHKLKEAVMKLERLGILKRGNEGVEVLIKEMHLSSKSELFAPYRTLLRVKANEQLQRLSEPEAYSFSVLFSADRRAKDQIHQDFLSFLKQAQSQVKKAKEVEVYQMNFDLFGWSNRS